MMDKFVCFKCLNDNSEQLQFTEESHKKDAKVATGKQLHRQA